MDMYEKLSRALLRRKYEKVDRSRSLRTSQGGFVVRKTVTVKIPRGEKGKKMSEKEMEAQEPLPIMNPKRFTILSSANDVVDEDWLREALSRTLDQGRFDVLTKQYPE